MWLKCVRHPKNTIFTQNFAMNVTVEVSFSQRSQTVKYAEEKKSSILCKIKSSNHHYQLLKPHTYLFLNCTPKNNKLRFALQSVLQLMSYITLFISVVWGGGGGGGHKVSYQNLFNSGLPGWMIIHILSVSLFINYVHDVRNYPD